MGVQPGDRQAHARLQLLLHQGLPVYGTTRKDALAKLTEKIAASNRGVPVPHRTNLPVSLRLLQGDRFERGPWHLGRWSKPIGVVAFAWTLIITVLFTLPTTSPVTAMTFNYTPVAVLLILGFAGIWWLLSARKWFTGP